MFISLQPNDYCDELFDWNDEPISVESKNDSLFFSETHRHVEARLLESDDQDLKKVQDLWDSYNEVLYLRCVKRFKTFLQSDVTLGSYIFYAKLKNITNTDKKKFAELSKAFHVPALAVIDELCDMQSKHPDDTLLTVVDDSNSFPKLMILVESFLLVVTHNMEVERGFSVMKSAECLNQSRMRSLLYDSVRFVRDRFDRSNFECFVPPERLLERIQKAGTQYKKESKQLALCRSERAFQTRSLQESVGVFKRHTKGTEKKHSSGGQRVEWDETASGGFGRKETSPAFGAIKCVYPLQQNFWNYYRFNVLELTKKNLFRSSLADVTSQCF